MVTGRSSSSRRADGRRRPHVVHVVAVVGVVVLASMVTSSAAASLQLQRKVETDAVLECPDDSPSAHYSSKTAYELVGGKDVFPLDRMEGCTAMYFWHLLRHGTRYPSDHEIAKLQKVVPGVRERVRENAERAPLCREALDRILSWGLDVPAGEGNFLTLQGERDLAGIATRFTQRYPTFFGQYNQLEDFTFRSTDSERTKESMSHYASIVLEGGDTSGLPEPVKGDPLLKFYDICPAWDDAVDHNATARIEVSEFESGAVMKAALQRVSDRLGFNETLSYEVVDLLWEACRYAQAWDPTRGAAWCAAFSEEDRLVFEYRADLKYYYVDSYGNDLNLKLGCPLVKNLVEELASAVDGKNAKRGNMYFTHSTAVHMTLAKLGIAEDSEPLTSSNYDRMKTSRKWNISQLGPFASNLAVVLYQCPAGNYKIKAFMNEKPVKLQGCHDEIGLCAWTDFYKAYSSVATTCNLDFCNDIGLPGSSSARLLASAWLISVFLCFSTLMNQSL